MAEKTAEQMMSEPVSVSVDETLSRALSVMEENNLYQLPVLNNGRYCGMIFLKDIVLHDRNLGTKISKLVEHVPTISESADIDACITKLISANVRVLPVVKRGRLMGIVNEHALMKFCTRIKKPALEIASRVIYAYSDDNIDKIRELMRMYGISRVPVLDREYEVMEASQKRNFLLGVIDTLDLIKVVKPRESVTLASMCPEKDSLVDLNPLSVAHPPCRVSADSSVGEVAELLRPCETRETNREVILVRERKITGLVAPKDVLEAYIREKGTRRRNVQISNIADEPLDVRRALYDECNKIMNKISRFLVPEYLFVYVDKHRASGKRKKYSVRARLKTNRALIVAHSYGWNLFTCFNRVIKKLNREAEKLNKVVR